MEDSDLKDIVEQLKTEEVALKKLIDEKARLYFTAWVVAGVSYALVMFGFSWAKWVVTTMLLLLLFGELSILRIVFTLYRRNVALGAVHVERNHLIFGAIAVVLIGYAWFGTWRSWWLVGVSMLLAGAINLMHGFGYGYKRIKEV